MNNNINDANVLPFKKDEQCAIVSGWGDTDKSVTPNGYGMLCLLHGFHIRAGKNGDWFTTFGIDDMGDVHTLTLRGPDGETHEFKNIPQGLCGSMAQVLAADYHLLDVTIKNGLTRELGVVALERMKKSTEKDQEQP